MVELSIAPYSSAAEDQDTILCFSHLRWDFVFQRPQHLLSKAARSNTVWYFEEPRFESNCKARLETSVDDSGVRIATPILPEGLSAAGVADAQRGLLQELLRTIPSERVIGWYYTPMALTFTDDVAFNVCVYDNMDELSAFNGAPAELVEMERQLFERADVVFTGGRSLYEAKQARHSNIHLLPSSIDAAHFAAARTVKRADPKDQAGIPHPRLGFFGVIDERLDIELLRELAELRPDWQFVMVGPIAKIDEATLPRLTNIHWLGRKSYADLPHYLSGWDVGLMPFALNASTRFISPTKTPEFLAAGLPVISSPIADVVRPYGDLRLVEIASDAESFAAKAEQLLSGRQAGWLKRVDAHLALGSWDSTWRSMDALIQSAMFKGVLSRLAVAAE